MVEIYLMNAKCNEGRSLCLCLSQTRILMYSAHFSNEIIKAWLYMIHFPIWGVKEVLLQGPLFFNVYFNNKAGNFLFKNVLEIILFIRFFFFDVSLELIFFLIFLFFIYFFFFIIIRIVTHKPTKVSKPLHYLFHVNFIIAVIFIIV